MKSPTVPRADVGDSDWTEVMARIGLGARGVVYLVFGLIAVRLAAVRSTDGDEASTSGAFGELVEQPFGTVLVALTVAGLGAWGASCALGAVNGRNGSKPGPSDTMDRVRDAGRAVLVLATATGGVAVLTGGRGGSGGGGGSGSDQERAATARLMDAPMGQVLVGVVGLALIGAGVYMVVKAARRKFLDRVELGGVGGPFSTDVLERIGVVGHAARGLVFVVLGGFVTKAAVEHDPNESRGVDAALRTLAEGGPGRVLLGLIAVGLLCFAVWIVVEAYARRSDV